MATALLKLAQTSAEFDKLPGARHLAILADGAKDADVENAVSKTVDAFGRIDVIVNNAQASVTGMLTEGSKEFFDANPEHYKHSLSNIPLAPLGDPEKDAGSLVVFLASEGAHYITGDTFNIDGGRCLRP